MVSIDPEEVFFFNDIRPDQAFHMQGVKFPIDIAFLDKDYGIIEVEGMEPETGRAKAPTGTAYAVEACSGYFQRRGLKAGDFWTDLHNKVSIKKY